MHTGPPSAAPVCSRPAVWAARAMDSVEYSGLRQFLLGSLSRESRVHRELWECNGATYTTYRKYLHHVREFGFPDEQELGSLPLAVALRKGSVVPADPLSSEPGPQGRKLPAAFSFSGVKHILDDCKSPVTVLSFGKLTSNLLAYASIDGNVWVARLGHVPIVQKLSGGHGKEIRGMDWSADNSWLVTCATDCSVCLWDVDRGICSRRLMTPEASSCCRFHPMNPNLLFVGNGGAISVMNLSTGSQAFSHTIAHGGSHPEVTALACSNTSMFAGDENGDLHVFRCEVHVAGSSQHLPAIFAWPHPGGKGSAIVSIQWQGYITAVKGPALLVMYLDSTVAVYKVYDGVSCRLELFTKAELPPAARRIRAVWCPSISIHEPQCIAAGGEDTNVHVYDIHRVRGTAVVVNQLQAHAAPVVDVSWSYDESCLASGDCDGTVIVWKRDRSAMSSRRTSAD